MIRSLAAVAAAVVVGLNVAQAQDAATLARIRDEGMNRLHVVELFNHLTNVIGPRLSLMPHLHTILRARSVARSRSLPAPVVMCLRKSSSATRPPKRIASWSVRNSRV